MAKAIDWTQAGLESLGHFKELLKIPTVNPPGNERRAAEYLARLFDQEQIPYRIVEAAEGRTNIVARLAGNGSARPILLNGHLDVVPVEPARWKHPPFEAVEAEGCVWGRGALDMKNMVAMAAMTLVLLKRMGVELKRDVIFAGVADEEAGCTLGSQYLVENHPDLVDAEYVLGEAGGHMAVSRAGCVPLRWRRRMVSRCHRIFLSKPARICCKRHPPRITWSIWISPAPCSPSRWQYGMAWRWCRKPRDLVLTGTSRRCVISWWMREHRLYGVLAGRDRPTSI